VLEGEGETAASVLLAKIGTRAEIAREPALSPTGSTPSASPRSARPKRSPTTASSRAGPRSSVSPARAPQQPVRRRWSYLGGAGNRREQIEDRRERIEAGAKRADGGSRREASFSFLFPLC